MANRLTAAMRFVCIVETVFSISAVLLVCPAVGQATQAQRVEADSVRAFMQTVASDVTHDGPTAWLKYFDKSPAFFMAVNGAMAFPDPAVARDGTEKFAATIQHIELKWGDDLRVDPLAPGLAVVGATWHEVQIDKAGNRLELSGYFTAVAERRNGRWKFRDAHWSSPIPAAPAK